MKKNERKKTSLKINEKEEIEYKDADNKSFYLSYSRKVSREKALLTKEEEFEIFKCIDEANEKIHLLFLNSPEKIKFILKEIEKLGVKRTSCAAICFFVNEFEKLSKDSMAGYEAIQAIYQKCVSKEIDLSVQSGIDLFYQNVKEVVSRMKLEYFFIENLIQRAEQDLNFSNWLLKCDYAPFESETIKDMQELRRNFNLIKRLRDKLVNKNHRLVLSLAKKYMKTSLALEDMDFVQEGYVGLIKGIDRFRYKKGYKLSTYINSWILQAIKEAMLTKGRVVRVTSAKLNSLLTEVKNKGEIKNHNEAYALKGSLSLHEKLGDEEDSMTFLDLVKEDKTLEEEFINFEKEILLKRAIDKTYLSSRDKNILLIRLGLSRIETESLLDISNMYGITPERVRQIEYASLERVRNTLSRYIGEGDKEILLYE